MVSILCVLCNNKTSMEDNCIKQSNIDSFWSSQRKIKLVAPCLLVIPDQCFGIQDCTICKLENVFPKVMCYLCVVFIYCTACHHYINNYIIHHHIYTTATTHMTYLYTNTSGPVYQGAFVTLWYFTIRTED